MTEEQVAAAVASLPGTSAGTSYGTSAWRVAGRVFLRMHEQPGVLVAWCADEHEKHALLAEDGAAYFTSPHYDGHASVLVRLDALDEDRLVALVTDAHRVRAPKRLLQGP